MRKAKFLFSLAVAALVASSVNAQDVLFPGDDIFTMKGEVEGWSIYADHERKACLAERLDENGNVVQMGLTTDQGVGYIGVFTQQDVGLSEGEHDISIMVNGNQYFGKSHVIKRDLRDGYQGGYLQVTNLQFVSDVQNGDKLLAFPTDTGNGVEINLHGSMKAIDAAVACTRDLNG